MFDVSSITDEELLRRAVKQACSHKRGLGPRWKAVMDTFMLGATFATQLCMRFKLDPDEIIRS